MQIVKEIQKPFIVGQRSTKVQRPDSIEAMTPDTDRMVKGVFRNRENPGQSAYVGCRLYKGQNFWSKWFQDGEEAVIPYSVARHINENTKHEKHAHILDKDGRPMKAVGELTPRYEFVPSDFS